MQTDLTVRDGEWSVFKRPLPYYKNNGAESSSFFLHKMTALSFDR